MTTPHTQIVARSRDKAPAAAKTLARREVEFEDVKLQLRATSRLTPELALKAAWALTGLKAAQAAKRRVEMWGALEEIADRVFARLSALEAEVAELRGEPTNNRYRAVKKDERQEIEDGVTSEVLTHGYRQTRKQRNTLRMSLVGDVTKARVQPLIESVKAADPDTPIRLTVESRGGNVDAAHDLADVLTRHRGETHVHALNDCSSAAVIIMLAGRKRTAEPGCSFVLHRPSLARRPEALLSERLEGALDNTAHAMARLLAARTGTDAEKWRPMLATSRGKRLTSAEAVEYGIIHALTPIKGRKARGK